MSNNASVAAAQKRRVGSQAVAGVNSVVSGRSGPDVPKSMGLTDVLSIQSLQLRKLKTYQEHNDQHWEANDEFLQQISEKVDEMSENQSKEPDQSDVKTGADHDARIATLESTVSELKAIIAGLQDDLLQKSDTST